MSREVDKKKKPFLSHDIRTGAFESINQVVSNLENAVGGVGLILHFFFSSAHLPRNISSKLDITIEWGNYNLSFRTNN